MKRRLLILSLIIFLLSRCSVNKDFQGRITKDFTAIAGASGKLKNDSLFRKTTVTLSSYSEFISLYNLQKTPKNIDKKYTNNFGNYVAVLDTLTKSVQNNTNGYESNYSKTMNYILLDVKDKYVNLCPKCQVQQYHPVLVPVKINVTDKTGSQLSGYTAFIEPALTYKTSNLIKAYKLNLKEGMVPGYYKVWIEKDGNKVKEKNEHIKNQIETFVINFQI